MRNIYGQSEFFSSFCRSARTSSARQKTCLWHACMCIYGPPMKPYICMHGMLNPKIYIWMRNIYGHTEFVSSSERSARTSSARQRIIFMGCLYSYLWIPPMKPYMCMHGMLNPKIYIRMRNISGTTMHDSSSERSSRDLYAHLKI